MKQVKPFEQFLNESKSSDFSHTVLAALEPTIIDMVERIKEWIIADYAKKDIKYEINEWEAEMIRLGLIVDMLKSFEKYTEPTDQLEVIHPRSGNKGIEISATIVRDGQKYNYFTEAIGAGGYNIQSFHFRYITKTNLPNAKVKGTLANEYAEKLKKMSKLEKINNEIKQYETRIENNNQRVQSALGLTDEEILAKVNAGDNVIGKPYVWPTWEELVKRDAAKNYNNDEAYYNQQKAESEASSVEFWKTKNIKWPQENNISLAKQIAKLKAKLLALV